VGELDDFDELKLRSLVALLPPLACPQLLATTAMSGPPPPSVLPPAAAPESAAVPAPNPPSRATSPGSATAATAFRPLNVRDALQYLDRVKQQFATEYQGQSSAPARTTSS
jgi:hypothetical protein